MLLFVFEFEFERVDWNFKRQTEYCKFFPKREVTLIIWFQQLKIRFVLIEQKNLQRKEKYKQV